MAIRDLFSKRAARQRKQGQEDVYQYDDLPQAFPLPAAEGDAGGGVEVERVHRAGESKLPHRGRGRSRLSGGTFPKVVRQS